MLVLSAPFPVIGPTGNTEFWFVSSQAIKRSKDRHAVAFFVNENCELVLHNGHLDTRGDSETVFPIDAQCWCPVHTTHNSSQVPLKSVLLGTWTNAWTISVEGPTIPITRNWQGDDLQIYFHTHFSPHASCSCAMLEHLQLTTVCKQECLFCCENFTDGTMPFKCKHIVHASCSKFMQTCPFCRSPRVSRGGLSGLECAG
jgi:hypothetical protein